MSAVALSEGTQGKSDGTVPLVRHDASWESVFAQLRSVPEEMMGTTTSRGLRKAWESSVFLFFALQYHQRHRPHFRWVAHR